MNTARSCPPPPPSRVEAEERPRTGPIDLPALRAKVLPRRPAMRIRTPRRYAGVLRAAAILDERMRARGISNIELAEVVGCDEKLIRDWRTGDESINIGDLYAADERLARDLIERVLVDLLTGANPNNHR